MAGHGAKIVVGCALALAAIILLKVFSSPEKESVSPPATTVTDETVASPQPRETLPPPKQPSPAKAAAQPAESAKKLPSRNQLEELFRKGQFDEGLALCRGLAGNTAPEAAALKKEYHLRFAHAAFEKAAQAADAAKVGALIKEMSELNPSHGERAARHWADQRLSQLRQAISSGNTQAADAAWQQLWDDPGFAFEPDKRLLQYKLERWRAALKAGQNDDAARHLRHIAELAPHRGFDLDFPNSYPGAEELAKEQDQAALISAGDAALGKNDAATATLHYMAALIALRRQSNAAYAQQEPVRQKIFASVLEMARAAEQGKVRGGIDKAIFFAAFAVNAHGTRWSREKPANPQAEYRVAGEAWKLLLRLKLDQIRAAMQRGDDAKADQLCRDLFYHTVYDYVQFQRDALGVNPFDQLSPEAAQRIAAKKPKDDGERWRLLTEEIRSGRYSAFPGSEKLMQLLPEILARRALHGLEKGESSALVYMQRIFQDFPESMQAEKVRSALVAAVQKAQAQRDHARILALTGYFLADEAIGANAPEARTAVGNALESVANEYSGKSKMSYVFVLSLLADAVPDEPRGQKARDDALRLGMEAVSAMTAEELSPPRNVVPSLIPGHTVDAVDNATSGHLLLFYNGPEQFYVRIGPRSAGSIVLKDGAYDVAVLMIHDNVRPYKGKASYATKFNPHRYVVMRDGKTEEPLDYLQADVRYRLLRAPRALGKLEVNRETGFVLPDAAK